MSPIPTRVVVTGATGFVGSHTLTALRELGVTPVAALRDPSRFRAAHDGPTLVGDLRDAGYRAALVDAADVIIHAGTWSAFWGHAREEREFFLEPTLDLLDRAAAAGVERFVSASTVALSQPASQGKLVDDDSTAIPRPFWPHHAAMVAVENRQRELALTATTVQVSARLGHFVGAGNAVGLAAALAPRLRTRQVPWVNHGKAHLPLVAGEDIGRALALAAVEPADDWGRFEAINIVGAEQPTAREAFTFLARHAGLPAPAYSVPLGAAYGFGALMEAIHPLTRAKAPFLTRSLVFVGEDWHMATAKAARLLGYAPRVDWRDAMRAQLDERAEVGFAWPELAQSAAR